MKKLNLLTSDVKALNRQAGKTQLSQTMVTNMMELKTLPMNMKKIAALICLPLLASSTLIGCQSTDTLTKTSPSMLSGSVLTAEQQLQQSQQAKKELKKMTAKQLRQSFSYQSDIKLSNAQRRQALAKATPKQLANADNKHDHCDHQHDTAYVALLKKADEANKEVTDESYDKERESIKNTYLNCQASYDDWYDDYYYGDYKSGEEPEYLPGYDTNHTAKDVKEENIVNNHLLQPLSIQASGSYQPLAGKLSLTPVMTYRRRNLMMSVNQPLYLDFKNGDLYLWADILGNMNSELVDDKLGTKWKNKWLKIGLNDGSLPENFSTELLKSYIEAMKKAYAQESVEDFSYLSPSQLQSKLPHLSKQHYEVIKNSKRVIRRELDREEMEQQQYLFSKAFYDSITNKYPELIDNQSDVGMQETNDMVLKKVSDGDFASILVKQYLKIMKATQDKFESEYMDDNGQFIHSDDAPITITEHFGIQRNKIAWMHSRYQLDEDKSSILTATVSKEEDSKEEDSKEEGAKESEGFMIDALTVFHPLTKHRFSNLPAEAQIPNAHNSVDVKKYGDELLAYYKQGGGTIIGKLIYQSYMDAKKMADQYKEEQETESLIYDEASLEEEVAYVDSESQAIDDTAVESDENTESHSESAECVLVSVSIDMMCSDGVIDLTDPTEVAACEKEKKEMTEAFEEYCQ